MKDSSKTSNHDDMSLLQKIQELTHALAVQKKQLLSQQDTLTGLIQTESLLNNLLNSISAAIYFKDLDSRFLKVSAYMSHKVGAKSPEDMIGKTDFDFFSQQHAQQAYDDEQKIIKTGKPIGGIEEVETWPDGHKTYVITSKAPLYDDDGNIIGTLGTSKDITRQKELEFELERLARLDGLTGISNRRVFDETLDNEWRRALRGGQWISIIMMDIDFFKLYNDHYGHIAGDDCLKKVAAVLQTRIVRPGDFLSRYGGEEFAIILTDTNPEGAVVLAEEIRLQIEELRILHETSTISDYVTVSSGVAGTIPTNDQSVEEFLVKADKALYRAKFSGRNQISI